METTIEVNGTPVKIKLTKAQIDEAIKNANNLKITDKVKSYEDACAILGIDPECRLPYEPDTNEPDEMASNAFAKMRIITKALNEGWFPDWKNTNEAKYYPWFKMDAAGFGFSFNVWTDTCTVSCVGSRLCFKTSTLAEYAGKQFTAIYKDFYTL